MVTIENVKALIAKKVEQLKIAKYTVDDIPSKKQKELDPPDLNTCYSKCAHSFQRIRPHADESFFPSHLFLRSAPNQKKEEFEYSKQIYKDTGTPTHSYWAKALSKINRIWNEKNYFIKYPEIESVEFTNFQPKDYFDKDYPYYESIEAYFREVVSSMKFEDPNAWACLSVDVPMEGEIVDQSIPVAPYITIVPCYKAIDFEDGHWLLTMSDEHSNVFVGELEKMEGLIFEFRDHEGLFRISQTGKKEDYTFSDPELIYQWGLEYLPCKRLQGQPNYHKGKLYYSSYFSPAVSSLNVALLDSNTLQVSKKAGAFPERWEYTDDCDACNGAGYLENFETGESVKSVCRTCNGHGRKNYSSKLSVLEIPVPKSSQPLRAETEKMSPPFAGYVPKLEMVEMLKFLGEEIDKNCVTAFSFINIDVSNSEVKGSETALGKQIDREEFFSFLMRSSNELFSLTEFFLNTIGIVRYGAAWEDVEVGYPQNFTIRSDSELTEEISQAKESGIPTIAQNALIREWFNTRFNSRNDVERVFKLIAKVDRLYSFTPLEIVQKLSVQIIAPWEAILHDSIDQLIESAMTEDESFWDKDVAEQKAVLVEKAKVIATEITPKKIDLEGILA